MENNDLTIKYMNSLKTISEIYKETPAIEKYRYIGALKGSELTKKEAEELGFNCSSNLWSSCLNGKERNHGGRKSIKPDLIESAEEYVKSISSVASNRVIKKNDVIQNVYHCDRTMTAAYSSFPFKNELSMSSFRKYNKPYLKKPKRRTDLCDYCENGKQIRKKIIDYCQKIGYVDGYREEQSEREIMQRINDFLVSRNNYEEDEAIMYELKDYKEVIFHKETADRQRRSYNEMRTDEELLKKNILIDIDFKEKIIIGMGPNQRNKDFYNYQKRSLLGIFKFTINYFFYKL